GWYVGNSLRALHIRKDMRNLTVLKIDNADAVVLKLGNEQSPPGQIRRHMVDASANVAQWDLRLQGERVLVDNTVFAERKSHNAGDEQDDVFHEAPICRALHRDPRSGASEPELEANATLDERKQLSFKTVLSRRGRTRRANILSVNVAAMHSRICF